MHGKEQTPFGKWPWISHRVTVISMHSVFSRIISLSRVLHGPVQDLWLLEVLLESYCHGTAPNDLLRSNNCSMIHPEVAMSSFCRSPHRNMQGSCNTILYTNLLIGWAECACAGQRSPLPMHDHGSIPGWNSLQSYRQKREILYLWENFIFFCTHFGTICYLEEREIVL